MRFRGDRGHFTRRHAALYDRLLEQEVPQVFGQIMCRRITLGGPLCHRLLTDAFQFLRQFLIILPERFGLEARHLLEQLLSRIAPERLATRQQFVKHDSQAENVAATINPMTLASRLFGTRVGGRPGEPWSLADVLFSECQPEIDDVGLTARYRSGYWPASRPDGRVPACGRNAGRRPRSPPTGRLPDNRAALFQPFFEVGPIDKFRDNVTGAVLRAAHIIHRHDAGMVEIGDRPSLGQVRFRIFGLGDQPGVRHLDGDGPVQLLIVSEVDKAEAPLAQHFLDAVATDPLGMLGRCSRHVAGQVSLRWSSVTSTVFDSFTSARALLTHARHLRHFGISSDFSNWDLGVHDAAAFRTAERCFLPRSSSKVATATLKNRDPNRAR